MRSRRIFGWGVAAPAFIGLLGAILLLWGLDRKFLWQDEAQTAVLATRLLRFGRPLAYDGRNLLTIDNFLAEDPEFLDQRVAGAQAGVDYHFIRGEYKADTTWKWHPWGQFVLAAAGIKLLGPTTLGARLPFALAGLVTLLLLYRLVAVYGNSTLMASLAAVLLLCNSFWILHARQARYYSPSSLFLVLTFLTYLGWQSGKRWGAAAFVAAAWYWFQVDYGTVFPVVAVLFADALTAPGQIHRRPVLVGLTLVALILPFASYYELWGRTRDYRVATWSTRLVAHLFNMNEYILPFTVVIAVAGVLVWRWGTLPRAERRMVLTSCGILAALIAWAATAAPFAFLRYTIMSAPVGCFLVAWAAVRGCPGRTSLVACAGAVLLTLTPLLSAPFHLLLRPGQAYWSTLRPRPELRRLARELFGHQQDPNRMVVEWLRKNVPPYAEILINYEDIPLMYYLPNPIRGGIGAFRVEDDARVPPDIAILRRSVPFVHWPVFLREVRRYQWERAELDAPDVVWGNNPDPETQNINPDKAPPMIILRRVREAGR